MEICKPDTEGIMRALEVLHTGGVVAHATETCYGLACDMRNAKAVQKLFAIKQRPEDQPVSALFAGVDQAKEYVEWNAKAQELADEHLPGPLTLILPLTQLDILVMPAENTVKTAGVRISSHPVAQALVEQFGSPISTTSANVSTQPSPYSAEEITEQFQGQPHQPDLILDSGTLPDNPSSKILDLTKESIEQLR